MLSPYAIPGTSLQWFYEMGEVCLGDILNLYEKHVSLHFHLEYNIWGSVAGTKLFLSTKIPKPSRVTSASDELCEIWNFHLCETQTASAIAADNLCQDLEYLLKDLRIYSWFLRKIFCNYKIQTRHIFKIFENIGFDLFSQAARHVDGLVLLSHHFVC